MFDLGWQELLVIALVAIIVISPKELPQAIRAVTQFARQLRGLSREFRSGVSELVREAELDELRRQVEKAGRINDPSDPVLGNESTSRLADDFNPKKLAEELKRRLNSEASLAADKDGGGASTDGHPGGLEGGNPPEIIGPASEQKSKKADPAAPIS